MSNLPQYDPVAKEHYWQIVACYTYDGKKGQTQDITIDHENLFSISAPGCYHCFVPYSPEVKDKPCYGDPFPTAPVVYG